MSSTKASHLSYKSDQLFSPIAPVVSQPAVRSEADDVLVIVTVAGLALAALGAFIGFEKLVFAPLGIAWGLAIYLLYTR